MIGREAEKTVKELWRSFPVVIITGPRQSGKTTLAKMLFPELPYANCEDPSLREFAEKDPRGFLGRFASGGIIDEVQRVPELLSYIQVDVDEKRKSGLYVLTGSNQLEYMKSISQSLAGRAGIIKLLPFSYNELYGGSAVDPDSMLFQGFYPPLHDRNIDPNHFYSSYLMTYLERDVRNITQVHNLSRFQRFIELCAGRSGHVLNKNSLANECGISSKTAEEWLSVLEASFIVYRLRPYHANFNKRIIKSPKLYFFDTGFLCYLLRIEKKEQLQNHYLRGEIFETFVAGELLKHYFNYGRRDSLYFFRDSNGNEIDFIIDTHFGAVPLEVKSGATVRGEFFKGLSYFNKISGACKKSGLVVGADLHENRSEYIVRGYKDIYRLHDELASDDNRAAFIR